MGINLSGKKSNRSDSMKSINLKPTLGKRQTELDLYDFAEIGSRGVVISGNLGCGKTEIAKRIHRRFFVGIMSKEGFFKVFHLRTFDVVGNWLEEYPNPEIVDETTRFTDLDSANTFILKTFDKETRLRIMEAIIKAEFEEQREIFLDRERELEDAFIYVIEEANTIFTTQSINKGFWLDFVAYARNLNIVGVYIMQRLSDSSTKVIERIPNFIFGQTRGQNDKRKIKAMLPTKEARKTFENLGEHEFLCFIGNKPPFVLELDLTK